MDKDSLKSLISNEINKIVFRQVGDDEPLLSAGLLDSITAVDLAIFIEEQSGINVPFQEINQENFDSVNKIMDYLSSK